MRPRSSVSDPTELGQLLREARNQLGLTQQQVASELGISQAYVSELETGKDSLALTRAFDLMRLVGVTLRVELPEARVVSEVISALDQAALAELCGRYGVAELAVFGSVASGTARPESDVDLLYTLREGVHIGWAINDLADDLEALFDRPVDLVGRSALHPRLRERVLADSQVIYAS